MHRARTFDPVKAVGAYESKKIKRYRSAFTTSQINYLEKQFEKCPYIGSATRKEVANLLNIPERAIKIWFQNRRMKEKKESSNKEYNIDCHNNLGNNIEFVKDSLINVHSSQSANDRQCLLQSSGAKYVDTTNYASYYNDATFPNQSKIINLKRETNDNRQHYKFKGDKISNNIKQNDKRNLLPTHLKCSSNKNYNNKNYVNYLEVNKESTTKCKTIPITTLNPGTTKDVILNVPSTLSKYQDVPEDLSARNLSNVMIPQKHHTNMHLSSAFIPFCNTQDVCLSPPNVIWKPVNILPAMPPNTVPKRQLNTLQNNVPKCKCNCNCQSKRINYGHGNVEPQPQYVIAIPFNNSLNILR